MKSSLEKAVYDHFREELTPMIGRSPRLDTKAIEGLIEHRAEEALTILRETFKEDAVPTEADLFRATMEASQRKIESMISQMRNASVQDPRRRAILSALADDAEQNLAAFRTLGPDVDETQLGEVSEAVIRRARTLKERFGFTWIDPNEAGES